MKRIRSLAAAAALAGAFASPTAMFTSPMILPSPPRVRHVSTPGRKAEKERQRLRDEAEKHRIAYNAADKRGHRSRIMEMRRRTMFTDGAGRQVCGIELRWYRKAFRQQIAKDAREVMGVSS